MKRVLVLGRGGAGKSTFARRLGAATGVPVVELDKHFWQPGLIALRSEEWAVLQRELVASQSWILDGDLGPYDVLEPRLKVADTIFVLDYSLSRCVWRSARRGRERLDYCCLDAGVQTASPPDRHGRDRDVRAERFRTRVQHAAYGELVHRPATHG